MSTVKEYQRVQHEYQRMIVLVNGVSISIVLPLKPANEVGRTTSTIPVDFALWKMQNKSSHNV